MNYKDILKSEYFKAVYAEIEELKKDFCVNHGFIHVYKVIENAQYLAEIFQLSSKQKELLLIASALHDIGYLKGRDHHAENGSILAREYLKDKVCNEDVEIICRAIACHGGKDESDYIDPVSLCLILADKFDFSKQRYKEDQNEPLINVFLSIEKVLLGKIDDNKFDLQIYTTDKSYFVDLTNDYFFNKLNKVLDKVRNACGYNINIKILDADVMENHVKSFKI